MKPEDEPFVPLSQLPEHWSDSRLLGYEPFKSKFVARTQAPPQRKVGRYGKGLKIDWPGNIWSEIYPEFFEAFVRWTALAFKPNKGDDCSLAQHMSDITKDADWGVFVEFYWELYQEHSLEAHVALKRAREGRGLSVLPESSMGSDNEGKLPFRRRKQMELHHPPLVAANVQPASNAPDERLSPSAKETSLQPPGRSKKAPKQKRKRATSSATETLDVPTPEPSSSNKPLPSEALITDAIPVQPKKRQTTKTKGMKGICQAAERENTSHKPKRKRNRKKRKDETGVTIAQKSTDDRQSDGTTSRDTLSKNSSAHSKKRREGIAQGGRLVIRKANEQESGLEDNEDIGKKDPGKEDTGEEDSIEVENSRWSNDNSLVSPRAPSALPPDQQSDPTDRGGSAVPRRSNKRDSRKGKKNEVEKLPVLAAPAPLILEPIRELKRKNRLEDACDEGGEHDPPVPLMFACTETEESASSSRIKRVKLPVDTPDRSLDELSSLEMPFNSFSSESKNKREEFAGSIQKCDNSDPSRSDFARPFEASLTEPANPFFASSRVKEGRLRQPGRGMTSHFAGDASKSFVNSPASSAVSTLCTPSTSSEVTLIDGENEECDDAQFKVHKTANLGTNGFFGNLCERIGIAESYSLNYECPKIPLPDGVRPRIWAASRQAICETSSWFRSYHGGVYQNKENVYGYLLGGYSSQRDKFLHEGRFIISHGGGKSLEDSLDQRDNDRSVRALLRNYENRSPIVLVADDKYVLFPYDLGKYMYVVLGLYWITDAWAEKEVFLNQGNYEIRVKYKFSFQYCEGQGCPWWLADGRSSTASSVGSSDVNTIADDSLDVRDDSSSSYSDDIEITCANNSDAVIRCESCGQSSPSVYREGWMCLRPSCTSFFQANSKEHFTLNYNDHFLELRPHPNFGRINLIPQSPINSLNAPPKDRYSPRGWWCPDCGQLCCRERWECWDCPDCKTVFKDIVQLPIRTHEEFWDQELKLGSFRCYKIRRGSGISFSASVWTEPDSNKVGPLLTFEFPEKRGRIHIIAGHRLVNHRANELFKLYQQEALSKPFLRRYPLRNHMARGRMLANYFSQNSGAPYKYVVGTNSTVPFDQAPEAVGKALQLIKDRASLVVGNKTDFNEILTAAYMEEQKMAYHSDSEKGLGPVVSSLSLGSIALMHFRLNKAQKEGPREKQLTLVLRHGDICVMEGAQIQDLYDHTVEPMNFRIAATARYIAPSY